jgi:PAS domain S-box-containing protein
MHSEKRVGWDRLQDSRHAQVLGDWVEQTGDGILIVEHGTAREMSVLYMNRAFERMSGYRAKNLHGHELLKRVIRKHLHRDAISAIAGAARMLSPISIDVATYRKDGTPILIDLALSPVFDEDGRCRYWVASCRDITAKHRVVQAAERRRAESAMQEHLRYLSFHDVLTGLPNRSLLLQHITSALMEHRSGATVSLQIERFDAIAGTLGRRLADGLLMQVSKRLRGAIPTNAFLARLENGSFAAWLPDVVSPGCADELIETMLRSLAEPFHAGSERIALRAHAGVAPAVPHEYTTAEDVLRDAEIAACAAANTSVRYRWFSPRLHEHSLTRMRVEYHLDRALKQREFVCHFQPIVSLGNGRLYGFEALVRWKDPERGLIPPDAFIPIAEESGHIARIGEFVLEEACREAMAWSRAGAPDLVVNVNVSARQFDDEYFADKVNDVLHSVGLSPDRLCLEITETALALDEQAVLQTLGKLRAGGVRVALDDFGVGYSSLGALRRLPLTAVKIDRSFISARPSDEFSGIADESVVLMIVALARARNLRVTAEGVESQRQLEEARRLGCTNAQGFFIARPMPADSVYDWLKGTSR